MMRWHFRNFVNGTAFSVWWWLAWSVVQVFLTCMSQSFLGYTLSVLNTLVFLLNLYSWDYQRRRAAGLLKDPQ